MTLSLRKSWKMVQDKARKEEQAELARRNRVDPYAVPQHVNPTRLVEAAISNDTPTVQLLLAKGQDINELHPILGSVRWCFCFLFCVCVCVCLVFVFFCVCFVSFCLWR